MRVVAARLAGAILACASLTLLSCGGGSGNDGGSGGASTTGGTTTGGTTGGTTGSTPTGSNVLPVIIDSGPNDNSVNTLYTTVTICVPGSTTQCQTIDHIQVDTGSNGLRVLGSVLTLSLPLTTAIDGNTLSECTQFVDGSSWGPVASADLLLSGETAASVPVQVIGASGFIASPDACTATGTPENTVAEFGANGILGVGMFEQDCGSGCATNTASGYYYSCSASACTQIAAPLSSQVSNPVALFVTDNNGTIIDLPAVPSPGATTLTGSLIFGIDTQTNNASGQQNVLTVDSNFGYFSTLFDAKTYDQSFIDSGTNGTYFDDSAIAQCSQASFSEFYCPATSQTLSATLTGTNGVSVSDSFILDNAQIVATNNPGFTVLPGLGGTYTDTTSSGPNGTGSDATDSFDWGLPFYYGRRIATALELHTTSVGTGPYVAF